MCALEQHFEYMDKNADGVVDPGEIEAFANEIREHIEQMQQQ